MFSLPSSGGGALLPGPGWDQEHPPFGFAIQAKGKKKSAAARIVKGYVGASLSDCGAAVAELDGREIWGLQCRRRFDKFSVKKVFGRPKWCGSRRWGCACVV